MIPRLLVQPQNSWGEPGNMKYISSNCHPGNTVRHRFWGYYTGKPWPLGSLGRLLWKPWPMASAILAIENDDFAMKFLEHEIFA